MNCPRCGAPIQPNFVRCAQCGLELQRPPMQQMYQQPYPPHKKPNPAPLIISLSAIALVVIILIVVFVNPFKSKPADNITVEDTGNNTSESTVGGAELSERVVFEYEGIKITVTGWKEGGLFGPELLLLIENDSDQDITVQCRDSSINGYVVDSVMSDDVPIGKKSNTSITFYSSDLENNGITDIEEIEFRFHIFNQDTWDTIVDSDIIKITF